MKASFEDRLAEAYLDAKEDITQMGFGPEIDWQYSIAFSSIGESEFLREAGWVILSTGMREQIIREKFPQVSAAFQCWRSAKGIVRRQKKCRKAALIAFNHPKKIDAIISVARTVHEEGFAHIQERILEGGVDYLESFDYVGPVSRFHLAKNLGLDVVKPDRHLSRVAENVGAGSAKELCEIISKLTGDKVAVVDVVIWRFANLFPNYLDHFRSGRFAT